MMKSTWSSIQMLLKYKPQKCVLYSRNSAGPQKECGMLNFHHLEMFSLLCSKRSLPSLSHCFFSLPHKCPSTSFYSLARTFRWRFNHALWKSTILLLFLKQPEQYLYLCICCAQVRCVIPIHSMKIEKFLTSGSNSFLSSLLSRGMRGCKGSSTLASQASSMEILTFGGELGGVFIL